MLRGLARYAGRKSRDRGFRVRSTALRTSRGWELWTERIKCGCEKDRELAEATSGCLRLLQQRLERLRTKERYVRAKTSAADVRRLPASLQRLSFFPA